MARAQAQVRFGFVIFEIADEGVVPRANTNI